MHRSFNLHIKLLNSALDRMIVGLLKYLSDGSLHRNEKTSLVEVYAVQPAHPFAFIREHLYQKPLNFTHLKNSFKHALISRITVVCEVCTARYSVLYAWFTQGIQQVMCSYEPCQLSNQ